MWHRAFETPKGRKIRDFPRLENGWCDKVNTGIKLRRKVNFPIPSRDIFLSYPYQKLPKIKKTEN